MNSISFGYGFYPVQDCIVKLNTVYAFCIFYLTKFRQHLPPLRRSPGPQKLVVSQRIGGMPLQKYQSNITERVYSTVQLYNAIQNLSTNNPKLMNNPTNNIHYI